MTSESAVERIPISLGIHSSFQAIIQGDAVLTYDVGEEVLRPARRSSGKDKKLITPSEQ